MFEGPAAVTGSVIPASTPTLDIQKHLTRLGGLFANICGYIFLALAVLVTCETLGRKLFNVSLQGVDELGGYVLAVGSSLAFTTALVDRAHIRIELFHLKLPQLAQMILNWMSVTLLAAFGALLAWVCYAVVIDSLEYGSTAPTPWATPLIYPQTPLVCSHRHLRTDLDCDGASCDRSSCDRKRQRTPPVLWPQGGGGGGEGRA